MLSTAAPQREGSLSAKVTRADGSVRDLGLVAYRSPNPIKHLAINAWIKLKRFVRG